MSFFDRIFKNDSTENEDPDIPFGRYSDAYKSDSQYDAWDQALQKFESGHYLDSFRAFFHYLKDEKEGNVSVSEEEGSLHFQILQGSKRISGTANNTHLIARAKVARVKELKIGFMRRLMEVNYALNYSRFALDENNDIAIVFDTYALDASPYKLYYALKEVAINADKQDDLLLDEFESLLPTDPDLLIDISEKEKNTKIDFIKQEITSVFNEIDNGRLPPHQYPGGIAYLLLHLTYKLDYLIRPEGFTMETLERLHRKYFSADEKDTAQKNALIRRELKKLLDRPREEFLKEMYRVKSTFGITSPVNHDKLVGLIDGELHNMNWYEEQQFDKIALAVPGYLVGYSIFNFSIPKPDHDYLHLFYMISEAGYFERLGFHRDYYNAQTGKLNARAIKKAIIEIAKDNKKQFPKLKPHTGGLDFSNLAAFSRTYLMMIRDLNLFKVK